MLLNDKDFLLNFIYKKISTQCKYNQKKVHNLHTKLFTMKNVTKTTKRMYKKIGGVQK